MLKNILYGYNTQVRIIYFKIGANLIYCIQVNKINTHV